MVSPGVVTARPLRGEVPPARGDLIYLVKDWVQAGADLLGVDPHRLRDDEYRNWTDADHILVTSTALKERLAECGFESRVMLHGFDSTMAAQMTCRPCHHRTGRRCPGPGSATPGASMDGLASTLSPGSRRWPEGSLILAGPVSPRLDPERLAMIARLTNVHLVPRVSRQELPVRLKHCDCLLMPYAEGEWQRYGSPLKLWDYLYAGPPLAGSGYRVLREFPPPLVHYATYASDLAGAVETALAEGRRHASTRRELAARNTWDDRARAVLDLLS